MMVQSAEAIRIQELQAALDASRQEVEDLKQGEKRIVAEMRKKADAARKLLEAKDAEIRKVLSAASTPIAATSVPQTPLRNVPTTPSHAAVTPSQAASVESSPSMNLNSTDHHHPVVTVAPAAVFIAPPSETPLSSSVLRSSNSSGPIRLGPPSLPSSPSARGGTSTADSQSNELVRMTYLRNVVCGLFRAKSETEATRLARVMAAVLNLDDSEQREIIEGVSRMVPGPTAASLESITNSFSSYFSAFGSSHVAH